MIATPLITKLKTEGGTLYTFTSTSKDLTKVATNNSNYKFNFSHFACLNLPYVMLSTKEGRVYKDIEGNDHIAGVNSTKMSYTNLEKNGEYFKSITSQFGDDVNINNQNIFYVYVEIADKHKSKIHTCDIKFKSPVSDVTYTGEIVGDGVFKFMIDFKNLGTGTVLKFIIYPNGDENMCTGELIYNTQYVGNDVEKGLYLDTLGDYIQEGVDVGDYNKVMAEHFQNYILNFESVILNDDEKSTSIKTPAERIFFNWLQKVGGIKFTNGSTCVEDISKYGYENPTIHDRTVQYIGTIDIINEVEINGDTFGEVYLYIPGTVGATPDIKFKQVRDTSYSVNDQYVWNDEHLVGRSNLKNENRPVDSIGIKPIYDISGDGRNAYTSDNGYCIDFDNFSESSSVESNTNFEFNCILIYYTLTKSLDNNSIDSETNLYGVLFLDNFKRDDKNQNDKYLAYIDTLPKFKSSELGDGNAFGLKLDLKIDTAPSTTMTRIEDCYEDPNNVNGLLMYMSALKQLHKCIDVFHTQQDQIYTLQDRVSELESILLNVNNNAYLDSVIREVNKINQRLNSNMLVDTKTIMTVLNNNTQTLDNIINGKYPTKLLVDTSTITGGNGIKVVEENDVLNISNTLQDYNYIGKISLDTEISGDYIFPVNNVVNLKLKEHSNLVLLDKNENDDSDISKTKTLTINIDATDLDWNKGQSFKIVTHNDFTFDKIKHKEVKIITHVKETVDGSNVGDNSILIKRLSRKDLNNMNSKSEIEIVCINPDYSSMSDKFITIIR